MTHPDSLTEVQSRERARLCRNRMFTPVPQQGGTRMSCLALPAQAEPPSLQERKVLRESSGSQKERGEVRPRFTSPSRDPPARARRPPHN